MKAFKIDSNKIDPGFKVPDQYFETLQDKIHTALAEEETPVLNLPHNNTKWIIAVAAVLLILFSITFLNRQQFSAPDSDSLEAYLSNTNLSNDEIARYLEAEDIYALLIDQKLEIQEIEEQLTNSDLENFITN